MTTTRPAALHPSRSRPSLAARRAGYLVGAAVDALLLLAVNRWPGWDTVPFLTADTERVLPYVNASLLVGVAAQLVYLVHDPAWIRALGDAVTTTVGLVALVRLWTVWPFDLANGTIDWPLAAHLLLGLGIVGSAIAILVALGRLLTASTR